MTGFTKDLRWGLLFLAIGTLALLASDSRAGQIGYIEDFALAKDRQEALKQLIPGTEDFYYYTCLNDQNLGHYDKVDETLKQWIKRYNRTERVIEIENRQALLRYPEAPSESLEYLRQKLGLHFNHQRDVQSIPNLPSSLDQNLIGRDALTKRALAIHPRTLGGFQDRALEWAATDLKLSPDRRRHLLSRLQRPDLANLVSLVVDDLNYKDSRGFGSLGIHKLMLLNQLDECLRKKPDLLNQTNFVNIYISKLRPSNDANWLNDASEREAYLQGLQDFIARLNPSHNSLKAHVQYRRLLHDRDLGIYNKDRFMDYLKLPRSVSYMPRPYLDSQENARYRANLNQDFSAVTALPVVRSDEALVRDYLSHFFIPENSYKPYETYVNDIFLKELFAETKIVNGLGDMERWYSMLPPAKYQALKERIDLELLPSNKRFYDVDEDVTLKAAIKNVKNLIVKVYEINTVNFYRENMREIDTDINLDGLVANDERRPAEYAEPALRRVVRTFDDFPNLNRRGVYAIEFIGNGKSSRALIRKGRLRYLARSSTAGHIFTILNEKNEKVSDATLWMGGREYKAEKDGTIAVPYSTSPRREPIILQEGDFASLDYFQHESENYSLFAGIHVDRESLLKRKTAEVIVRPSLMLNGTAVTLSVLQDIRLVIDSLDREGISSRKEIRDFKLNEDSESIYEFQVPPDLQRIAFTLTAKVENLSQNKKIDLAHSASFEINGIDKTDKVEDLHLVSADGEYFVDVLGKTGEAKAGKSIRFQIMHRDFKDVVDLTLLTDERGRIGLGELAEIDWIQASIPNVASHKWTLPKDRHSYPAVVHGETGSAVTLPYMGKAGKALRSELSLLEKRGNTFFADHFKAISIKNGLLKIDDLPPGDYDLLLKDSATRMNLKIVENADKIEGANYLLSKNRLLEERNAAPLQIVSIQKSGNSLLVKLENSTGFARVHVAATRYLPAHKIFDNLAVAFGEPYSLSAPKTRSIYLSGRNIGDEYRYIIERKYAEKHPGNMLKRPELLLNPWELRKTEAGRQDAAAGDAYFDEEDDYASAMKRASQSLKRGPKGDSFANLDFLLNPSMILLNLRPNKKGLVRIPLEAFGDRQQIHVLAVDPENTVYRETTLSEQKVAHQDLRLRNALDPEGHFTEQKRVSVVRKGGDFAIEDILTSRFEAYDTLGKIYQLYSTLSGDAKLAEFGFIVRWPTLNDKEKREKYSKYASHELNFFLYKKDPEFFKTAVAPYLKNKKDKTFLDDFLVGNDLSAYLKPWSFQRLNIVERILLARRLKGESGPMTRHVKDLNDLIPPNIDHFNHLFKTALKGSALETADNFAWHAGVENEELAKLGSRGIMKSLSTTGRTRFLGEVADMPAKPAPAASLAPKMPLLKRTPAPPPSAPGAGGRGGGASRSLALGLAAIEGKSKSEKSRSLRTSGLKKSLEAQGRLVAGRDADSFGSYFEKDGLIRENLRELYRKLDKTMEWAENNYYKLPIEQQNASLITVNNFWRDYAALEGDTAFFSTHLAEASRNFPEMMFALAVLDLPFESGEHESEFKEARFELRAGSDMVVFHKEIREAQAAKDTTPILVSQNFFRHGDRYRHVNNEQFDKFVTDEFLVHVVYGCQVVLTNPTSSRLKLDILLQIPRGAISVSNGKQTRGVHLDLQPYNTQKFEYFFYFPFDGDYPHYPVHVSRNEELLASAEPFTLHVVQELTNIDKTSWDYISQHGSETDVVDFLRENNINRLNLDRIAWRMKDKIYFQKIVSLLDQRHVYSPTLWSYGLKHNDIPQIRQYLLHRDDFLKRCGQYIDCELVTINPVARRNYQHLEYSPLVNARAHRLGKTREILNDHFLKQYQQLMKILSYREAFDDDDLMAVTYYLLLQDRIEEAMDFFARVKPANLETRLQHDYFTAYFDFFSDAPKRARQIAAKYKDYPVERWRKVFANVASLLDEIEGEATAVIDDKDRDQTQTQLAATEPTFDFKVEAKKINLKYQNLSKCRVNYYLMDIELLFSRNPFVQKFGGGQFSNIRPNETETRELDASQTQITFALPEKFQSKNVMIEIAAEGRKKSQTYYSNSMAVQMIETYGQVLVTKENSQKPLAKVYVKVYAKMKDGKIRFYKDGYTDLRGRFDYVSLNTNELDFVEQFSLLILSETHGAFVKEAAPPKR